MCNFIIDLSTPLTTQVETTQTFLFDLQGEQTLIHIKFHKHPLACLSLTGKTARH